MSFLEWIGAVALVLLLVVLARGAYLIGGDALDRFMANRRKRAARAAEARWLDRERGAS